MTPEWQAVAWALAAHDLDLEVGDLDLVTASRTHGERARAWLVARDAAHEWQIRQPIEVTEPDDGPLSAAWATQATQALDKKNLYRELALTRENLHRVTNELRETKLALAQARQAAEEAVQENRQSEDQRIAAITSAAAILQAALDLATS